jgi:hypothetical protein
VDSDSIRDQIRRDGDEVARLHGRVHATFALRERSAEDREAWIAAAKEFRDRHDQLSFPGGWYGARERLRAGEPLAIEAAVCFLEVRPFFYHSGFIFKDLMRWCRSLPLAPEQTARHSKVQERYRAWQNHKRSSADDAAKPGR